MNTDLATDFEETSNARLIARVQEEQRLRIEAEVKYEKLIRFVLEMHKNAEELLMRL